MGTDHKEKLHLRVWRVCELSKYQVVLLGNHIHHTGIVYLREWLLDASSNRSFYKPDIHIYRMGISLPHAWSVCDFEDCPFAPPYNHTYHTER